ncbi:hypothetical protein HMPREF1446_00563 [Helicobacter pylori HP250BFiV]|nr:hypothetical protein HMPREF1446_00563 [Helicobacter pylori HP250BFiV]
MANFSFKFQRFFFFFFFKLRKIGVLAQLLRLESPLKERLISLLSSYKR